MKSEDDLSDIIYSGIKTDFWIDYFEPELNTEIERCKEALLTCAPEEILQIQVRARTLREILEKPRKDYKERKEEKHER